MSSAVFAGFPGQLDAQAATWGHVPDLVMVPLLRGLAAKEVPLTGSQPAQDLQEADLLFGLARAAGRLRDGRGTRAARGYYSGHGHHRWELRDHPVLSELPSYTGVKGN